MSDRTIWAIIALVSALNAHTDITVIHGEYQLDADHWHNMVLHHFVILTSIIGVFFKDTRSILLHLGVVLGCLMCWYRNDGCFMADWQRANIPYTSQDMYRIHKTAEQRYKDLLVICIPALLIDVYKLRGYL